MHVRIINKRNHIPKYQTMKKTEIYVEINNNLKRLFYFYNFIIYAFIHKIDNIYSYD